MPARYDHEAIDKCLRLFLKFNGQQHQRIEQEMRKVYPGWQRSYLYTRGRGEHLRLGWIEQYGWEKALAIHLAQKPTATLNNAEKLVREIEEVRSYLAVEIKSAGGNVEKERLQLHRDYCNLSIAALTKVEAARDTLAGWVSFWEKLLDWATDVDLDLARKLVKFSSEIIARAEQEFGETQETVESVMNGNQDSIDTSALTGTQA